MYLCLFFLLNLVYLIIEYFFIYIFCSSATKCLHHFTVLLFCLNQKKRHVFIMLFLCFMCVCWNKLWFIALDVVQLARIQASHCLCFFLFELFLTDQTEYKMLTCILFVILERWVIFQTNKLHAFYIVFLQIFFYFNRIEHYKTLFFRVRLYE